MRACGGLTWNSVFACEFPRKNFFGLYRYGRGGGVGRGLCVGSGLGVGVGLGVVVAVGHCAVDHVKATLPLVQPQLEIGTAAAREVLRPPLDVKDAVGRTATYRGEYAKPAINQIQVVPIWEDGVVVGSPRQASVRKG